MSLRTSARPPAGLSAPRTYYALSKSPSHEACWALKKCRAGNSSAITFLVFGGVKRLPQSPNPTIPGFRPSNGPKDARNRDTWSTISLCAQTSPPKLLLASYWANLAVYCKTWHGPVNVDDIKPIA